MIYKTIEIEMGEHFKLTKDFLSTISKYTNNIDQENKKVVLNFTTAKNFNTFVDDFSKLITSISYAYYLTKYLNGRFNKADITSIIGNHLASDENTLYFSPLMKIIISEFFKNNNKINITSFILFNVSGMKKEIEDIADMEDKMEGRLLQATDGYGGVDVIRKESPNSNEDLSNEDFAEIIKLMRENYMKSKACKEDNENLLIFKEEEKIKLTNNKFVEINSDFFSKICKAKIETKSVADSDLGMMCFILALETLHPQKIVMFNGIDEETKDAVKNNIAVFNNKHDDDEVEFYTSTEFTPKSIK